MHPLIRAIAIATLAHHVAMPEAADPAEDLIATKKAMEDALIALPIALPIAIAAETVNMTAAATRSLSRRKRKTR